MMEKNMKKSKQILGIAVFSAVLASGAPVSAQMFNTPFTFAPQNRASIAALMKSVEDQGGSQSGVVAGSGTSGDITNLVCGADGTSSADGNSTCIILNNSDGLLDIGQESNGDVTATSDDTVNVDETINGAAPQGSISDALQETIADES